MKRIINYFLNENSKLPCIGNLVEAIKENDLFKKYSDSKEHIGCGVSSFIFKHKENGKVFCISNDIFKILYLKKAKIENFKLIKILEINEKDFVFLYEMNELQSIDSWDWEYAAELGNAFDYAEEYYEEVFDEFDLWKSIDMELIDNLHNHIFSKESEFLTFGMDLHVGQFMLNNNEEIVCIDPIISFNINF